MVNDLSPRDLPSVHRVLASPCLSDSRKTRAEVTAAVRATIDEARSRIQAHLRSPGDGSSAADLIAWLDPDRLAERALAKLTGDLTRPRAVINATGILLHTGLGRAPLAAEALEAIAETARGYCNLEFRLETGERGQRGEGIAELLSRLTGAEDGLVVNNNAAATVLALRALARDREVIVSRSQLVEIGGSFRLPEIFEVSGARLREVGTTNKTRLSDYESAIQPTTAALLRVHSSNYRIIGFTESVGIAPLARLGKAQGLWTIDDIGSGLLRRDDLPGLSDEPAAADSIRDGADLVLFSGDKLLGGPQAGLLVGSKAVIAKLRSDPLMRAFRVDKLTIAALDATLRLALDPNAARQRIPLWSFLNAEPATIRDRAERLAQGLRSQGWNARVAPTDALLGGGSAPAEPIPSFATTLAPPWPVGVRNVDSLARALRLGDPAIVARIRDGELLLDLRTMDAEQNMVVLTRIARLADGGA